MHPRQVRLEWSPATRRFFKKKGAFGSFFCTTLLVFATFAIQIRAAAPRQAGHESAQPDEPVLAPPYTPGVDATYPKLIHIVRAEYTADALKAHFQGICIVSLIVDAQGKPQNVRATKPLGFGGLERNAVDAVLQYRFKPAVTYDGTPVAVRTTIRVRFSFPPGTDF